MSHGFEFYDKQEKGCQLNLVTLFAYAKTAPRSTYANKYRPINLTTKTRTIKCSDWGVIDLLVRLALREEVSLKINGENGFYVHFGWDYYMYVGGVLRIDKKRMNMLFVEKRKSP